MTRRSAIVAVVGLAFAAAAGVGLAQITAGPSLSSSAAGSSTTQPQSTGTQTTGGSQDESADEQDGESAEQETETEGDSVGSPLTTTSGEDQQGKGQEKVTMCHKTGSSKHPSHTIVIASPAMLAHVAHGDTVGACAPSPATPPTQHEQKPKKQKPPKQAKAQKPAKAQKQAKQHGGNAKSSGGSHGNGKGK